MGTALWILLIWVSFDAAYVLARFWAAQDRPEPLRGSDAERFEVVEEESFRWAGTNSARLSPSVIVPLMGRAAIESPLVGAQDADSTDMNRRLASSALSLFEATGGTAIGLNTKVRDWKDPLSLVRLRHQREPARRE
jgi:hypothetical protein